MQPAETRRPLRILFSMRNYWFVRLFESVLRELASRGHFVHVLADYGQEKEFTQDWNEAVEALAREYPTLTYSSAPRNVEDDWVDLRVMIRYGVDYLRFRQPEYDAAPILESRARARTPAAIVRLADSPLGKRRLCRRFITGALCAAERAMPVDRELAACVASQRPDVVLVTPLITLGSEQHDVLRAARRLGLPTALCVGSWDHLSSKALIRTQPDRVFVWNETQRQEAATLHGVRPDAVTVTGAQCFDQWFERHPSLTREDFCRKVGLDPTRPFLLYVCSALFEGSPSEAAFVARWIAAVRASADPALRDAGILVRPHPKRGFEWDDVDLSGLPQVAVWPPRGAAPFDQASKADYFDSMFHSALIVGLNTSALIEGGIIGRPVHTVLLPEFADNQEKTLHFHYLLRGGLLRAARDLDSHVAQLAASLAASDPTIHYNRGFIERFVRPAGLNVAATPMFADAVEALATERVTPLREPLWVAALHAALRPLARRTSGTFAQQAARERRRRQKDRERQARRAARRAARDAEIAVKEAAIARKLEERRNREAERRRQDDERRRARAAAVASARAAKEAGKRDRMTAKARAKAARLEQWRREKQRRAWNARVAGLWRRISGRESTAR